MRTEYSLIIGGDTVAGAAEAFDVINPATGEAVASCPTATLAQLDQAVAAAQSAFQSWQKTSSEERKQYLLTIADRLEEQADEFARVITLEQGKPLPLAQVEVGASAAWIRATAELELPVKVIEDSPNKRIEMHHKPLGVVGSITPWNWPLMIAIWHIAPALKAGNTVINKPSGLTPLNTLLLGELMNDVLPAGVVNFVTGEAGIGRAISSHEGINKIVFTGSTPTGQDIMRNAAGNLKRLTLELGGNDAGIVLPGADIDAIGEGLFQTAFLNMGQTCAALKRLYVHESQYDQVCAKLVAIAEAQNVGNGMDDGVSFGPVQNKNQLELVAELVEDAKAQGGQVLTGGAVKEGPGYFYRPTIVSKVSNGVRLVDEEQFGPVLPVISYSTVEEAVTLANANDNGLGGSVWGSDLEEAQAIGSQLECGTLWINNHAEVLPHAPFGGCKMSGCGVEFGEEGLLEYTVQQVVNITR